MVQLGQNGADTVTHIVSLIVLLGLGLGVPAIIGEFQHQPLDDVALIGFYGFEATVAVCAAYYSIKYQTSGTTITTDPTPLTPTKP